MFESSISKALNARHFLRGDFGDESVPHTHPYRVVWTCRSSSLDENGFATDIALMQEVLAASLQAIDGVLLNDLPWFADRQPSLEHLAVFLSEDLRSRLAASGTEPDLAMRIEIREADDAWAAYEETR